MRVFSEQQIASMAPNANAVNNARKISSGGGFVSRMRSEDDTFYMGICKGSGRSNYSVSADFIEGDQPVLRCSCPSRQFPCKHSLALLYELAAGKEFTLGEIPEDILEKRKKKEAREAKKAANAAAAAGSVGAEGASGTGVAGVSDAAGIGTAGNAGAAGAKTRKTSAGKAARTKKIKKQLEGLTWMKQLTDQLVNTGLASMGSVSLKDYRNLAKQLGDYYLPGPQVYFNRLVLEMEAYQKDQDERHYHNAVEVLKKLRALEKKAAVYLQEKLDTDSPEADGDMLYEELGGIWKLEQLNALGLKKEQVRLMQLAFHVVYDDARKEYIDTGYWIDLDSGEISCTLNYRPVRALKYVKQEDSCFQIARVPVASYYPGGMNKRIRWEQVSFEEADEKHRKEALGHAYKELPTAVRTVKNELKNILSDESCAVLLQYAQIGIVRTKDGDKLVMADGGGNRIELRTPDGWEDTLPSLRMIPDGCVLREQALFGLMYYDQKDHAMCVYPCSIVTEQGIIRLLY